MFLKSSFTDRTKLFKLKLNLCTFNTKKPYIRKKYVHRVISPNGHLFWQCFVTVKSRDEVYWYVLLTNLDTKLSIHLEEEWLAYR